MCAGGGLGGDVAGSVGGVVVDDDQLPLLSERETGFGLGQQGGEAGGKGALLVAGGDDDGEFEVGLVRANSSWLVGRYSFTSSYYRKWRVSCVELG